MDDRNRRETALHEAYNGKRDDPEARHRGEESPIGGEFDRRRGARSLLDESE